MYRSYLLLNTEITQGWNRKKTPRNLQCLPFWLHHYILFICQKPANLMPRSFWQIGFDMFCHKVCIHLLSAYQPFAAFEYLISPRHPQISPVSASARSTCGPSMVGGEWPPLPDSQWSTGLCSCPGSQGSRALREISGTMIFQSQVVVWDHAVGWTNSWFSAKLVTQSSTIEIP